MHIIMHAIVINILKLVHNYHQDGRYMNILHNLFYTTHSRLVPCLPPFCLVGAAERMQKHGLLCTNERRENIRG